MHLHRGPVALHVACLTLAIVLASHPVPSARAEDLPRPARPSSSLNPLELVPSPTTQALKSQRPDCCGGFDCTVPQHVSGTVRDAATNSPIAGARVTFCYWGGSAYSTLTNGAGQYGTPLLDGSFTAVVEAGSFVTATPYVGVGCYDYCCYGYCWGDTLATRDFSLTRDPCAAWNGSASDPIARAAAAAVSTSPYVYVLGGANATGYVSSHSRFNASTETWTTRTDMPEPRAGFAAGLLGSFLLVAGGLNSGGAVATTRRYDPASNAWAPAGTIPDMPNPGWGVAGVVLDGRFWILGGYNDTQHDMGWLRVYDPATNTWSLQASLESPRSWLGAATLDGKIFAIGGTYPWSNGVTTPNVEIYDPANNSWSYGPSLPQPLKDLSAVTDAANNRILVIGGTTGDGAAGTEVAYRAVLQLKASSTGPGYEWSYLNGYPSSGAGVATGMANGVLFGFGGRTAYPASYSALTWKLLPPPIPAAPAGLSTISAPDNTAIRLSWNAVAGAASYHVVRSGGSTSRSWTVAASSSPSHFDPDVIESVPYTYSVTALNACGTEGAPTVAGRSLHYPVVFVHGICDDPAAWTTWSSEFASRGLAVRHMVDLRRKDPSSGLPLANSANQAIEVSAGILRDKVQSIPGKVNLVAHSMGGIVSRHYIEQMGGASRVNKLVMMGTPNHGSGGRRVLTQVLGYYGSSLNSLFECLAWGQADNQLAVNSEFMRKLNYGAVHGVKDEQCQGDRGVENIAAYADRYWTIAGTGSQSGNVCQAVNKRSETWRCTITNKTNDGFISVGSVHLDALPAGHNLIDFDLVGSHLYHSSPLSLAWLPANCNVSYLSSTALAAQVAHLLKNESLEVPAGQRIGDVAGLQPSQSSVPADSLDAVDLPYVSALQQPSTVIVSPLVVPTTPEATFYCFNSAPDGIEFLLRTPAGALLSSADTAGSAALVYRSEPENHVRFFVVSNPEPGTWELLTDATLSTSAQRIGLIGQVLSNSNLLAVMDTLETSEGTKVRVTGMPTEYGVLVTGASVAATVLDPSGALHPLSLHDDGEHSDGASGDGVYAGSISPGAGAGVYGADVEASWLQAGENVARATSTSYAIIASVDLEVDSSGVVPSVVEPDSGALISLSLVVRNRGSVGADSALVRWLIEGVGEIGQLPVSVPAQDSSIVTVPWRALGGDTVVVHASVSVGSGTERNYDNNVARTTVVLGPSVLAVEPAPVPAPARFEVLPPRPNPTRGSVEMRFRLPYASSVEFDVFDVAGRRIQNLGNDQLVPAGEHSLHWDGRDHHGTPVAHGIYLLRLRTRSDFGVWRVVMLR